MKVVVVGSGGREHAIAWKLRQCGVDDVRVVPGNGGTGPAPAIKADDVGKLRDWCVAERPDLVVVGPEAALAAGLVDALRAAGLRALGPTRDAARLESSKVWAREFMRRNRVAIPQFRSFASVDEARAGLQHFGWDAVLKFDGLAAGKGVWVCRDRTEGESALAELAQRHGADARGLVEQRLVGRELSVIGVTDGETMRLFAPSRDHKRLLDGDQGPNTGGMGAFAPVRLDARLERAIERDVIEPTLEGLAAERIPYRGFLYAGLILCDDRPKVLEYNARLGDPETEVMLPGLESDFVFLLEACVDGRLADCAVSVSRDVWVDVVLASGGYPGTFATDRTIEGLEALSAGTLVFHAGTARRADGTLVTAGGRVLNVVARGADLDAARAAVYAEIPKIRFDGMTYRRDIGAQGGTA